MPSSSEPPRPTPPSGASEVGVPSKDGSGEVLPAPDACPSENDLLDLALGRADPTRAEALRAHLLGCSACQGLVGDVLAGEGASVRERVLTRGDSVGRYVVLGPLGAGAMGVVYEAYDPELDRKVALKLVRTEEVSTAAAARTAELRTRLQREAQAMAKLAHPNVIAVYDVGEFEGRVFVAMELVTGGTLAAWLRAEPRTQGAILEMFLQAGRGLAAAHAAGLVHRDFKPDNVLVGADGRVRVTDFGLARFDQELPGTDERSSADHEPPTPVSTATLTRTGAAVGTPAYMAPEQIAGKRPDARADIYGYSVALYEALTGERPFTATTIDELKSAIERGAIKKPGKVLPSAIQAVIKKGLAARPEDRFQSMPELLAALAPRTRRPWLWALAAALTLAFGAVVFALRPNPEAPACEASATSWGDVWNDAAKARVRTAFEKTGLAYAAAAFTDVDRAIEERRAAWSTMSTEACRATKVAHTQSQELLDRRTSCLDQRRRETASLITLLEAPDEELVERASSAVKALTPLDDCANARALGESVPVTGEQADAVKDLIAQAHALRVAGRYQKGLDVAIPAVEKARELGDPRTLAAALVIKGLCQEELMTYRDAEATYHEAVRVALSVQDATSSADAWMQLSGIAAYRRQQVDEGYLWLGYAQVMISNLGEDRKRLAKMYERRSLIEWSMEARLEDADLDFARHLAMQKGLPLEAADQFRDQHGNVAFDMGRYDVALRIFEDQIATIEREKGHDHPEMLEAAENRAEVLGLIGRPEEAIPIYKDLLVRFADRAAGYTNHRLAEAYRKAGDAKSALEQDEIALKAQANDPPDSLDFGWPLTGKGLDLIMLGRPAEAIEPLERAATIRKRSKLRTARAETDFALARALWDSSRDKQRAAKLAESAAAAYLQSGEQYGSKWYKQESAAIDAWRKTHTP